MDLKRYRGEGGCAPRNNSIKPEEAPGNRFIIQEHQAVGFHFDFKLEIKDKNNKVSVLHSWIIPKNIPLEPEVKHLAIKVDNESLRFLESDEESVNEKFSEVKLKVWDRGRWGLMRGDIENGAISFNLFGKIIKARYTMQKLREDKKKNQKNHWVIWRVTGYK